MISAGQTTQTAPVTNETLDLITAYACTADLSEDNHAQCVQTLADTYILSLHRVPESLTATFDGMVKSATGLLFSYCGTSFPSDTEAAAQCMLEAVNGGDFRFPMLGKYLTYPQYIVQLSYLFSGFMLTRCVHLATGDIGGPVDMRDGVEDGLNCTPVKACLPTLEERTTCEEETHFGEPDFSQSDYDACILNACAVRGRRPSNPWSTEPYTPPHVPVAPPPQCVPTFTQIQICAQQHSTGDVETMGDCLRQLCEESRDNYEAEQQSQESTTPETQDNLQKEAI